MSKEDKIIEKLEEIIKLEELDLADEFEKSDESEDGIDVIVNAYLKLKTYMSEDAALQVLLKWMEW